LIHLNAGVGHIRSFAHPWWVGLPKFHFSGTNRDGRHASQSWATFVGGGGKMTTKAPTAESNLTAGDDDGIDHAALERIMAEVPRGALALAGLAVGLLAAAWFAIYLLVFLPRGPVS
jgi:hypothetical protein